MKAYILLPFVLLAGLVIGGVGPRSELAELRAELEQMKKLVPGSGGAGAGISEVSSLLGIARAGSGAGKRADDWDSQREETAVEAGKQDAEVKKAGEENSAAEDGAVKAAGAAVPEELEDDTEGGDGDGKFAADLDRAIELWQTRVDIAKSTFIANTRLNDAQAAQLETMLAAMNIRIGTTIDKFAADVKDAESVQPEAGIRLVNDITESMVLTYDEMDKTMPKGWRRRSGESFSLTDFIDPEVARPMVGLEGKFNRMVK